MARKDSLRKVLNDGTIIVDEMCECGHLRSAHMDTFSVGHGRCRVPLCDCKKFTWKEFVYEDAKGE